MDPDPDPQHVEPHGLWLAGRFLDLSLNRLRSLGEKTLAGLNQLEEIDLSNNRIERIGPGAFQSLHHLKILDLSHNRIQVQVILSQQQDSGAADPFTTAGFRYS
jgi:Leucine-rich repeat (LRR) protein